MSEEDHNHGTPRNPRTWSPNEPEFSAGAGGGRTFYLLTAGVLIAVLAGALMVVASMLKKTREDLWALEASVLTLKEAPPAPPAQPPTPGVDLTALREELDDLRSELSQTLSQSTLALRDSLRDAKSERDILRRSLARLLKKTGSSDQEIDELLVGLTSAERETLLEELKALHPGNGSSDPTPPTPTPTPTPPTPTPTPTPTPPQPEPEPGPEPEPEPEPEPAPSGDPEFTEYRVKSGDNLLRIAREHGVTVDAIVKASNLRNPDRLSIGQVLKIPAK